MITANIHEAKTNLSKLLKITQKGERVIIKKFNKPIAQIVPYETQVQPKRKPGSMRGKIHYDQNLWKSGDKEIENLFCEGDIASDN